MLAVAHYPWRGRYLPSSAWQSLQTATGSLFAMIWERCKAHVLPVDVADDAKACANIPIVFTDVSIPGST